MHSFVVPTCQHCSIAHLEDIVRVADAMLAHSVYVVFVHLVNVVLVVYLVIVALLVNALPALLADVVHATTSCGP